MQTKLTGPIGVFDSGYGGLTVLTKIMEELPEYDYLYLGDNARAPYGTRSFDIVYEYTLEAVTELFERGCPLVILACNTASAKALRSIQQNDLPKIAPDNRVLGVIRPTSELVGEFSPHKTIGILATPGTVNSNSYPIEIGKFAPTMKVFSLACPMWVPLIENGEHHSKAGKKFIRKDVKHLLEMSEDIDTILLACTHYPLVEEYIKEIVSDDIQVISQGEIVAKSLKEYLMRHPEMEVRLSKNKKTSYLTSGDTETFDTKAKELFGLAITSTQIHL